MFKTSGKDDIKDRVKKHLIKYFSSALFASFLIPTVLMVCVYAYMNVFPFGSGKGSVLIYDLNAQYVYFFEALRDFIWGDSSLLYSFSRSLGGEFMGIYAYYLASPLSYIVALFPKKNLIDALFVLFVLKSGLCSLTFSYYLKKKSRLPYLGNVILSSCYAMSAYVVVMQHNTMWMEGVILLPLIILGLEELIYKNKYKLYTVTLALSIICNYYIAYMTCIFVFIYFFYLFFSKENSNSNKEITKLFIKSITRVGFFSAIAILIASIMLIPAYYGLTFGKTTFSTPDYSFKLKFNPLSLIYKCCALSYDTLQGDGLPFIYCGTLVIFALAMYFTAKKISKREKIASLIIISVFLISMMIDPIDMVWHGMQTPNCLNYRYAFIFVFFILSISAKGIEKAHASTYKVYSIVYASSVILLIISKLILGSDFPLYTLLSEIGFLTIFYIVFLLYSLKIKFVKKFVLYILFVLVICELVFVGIYNMVSFKRDVGASSRASYIKYFEMYENADNASKNDDTLFYRIEKIYHRTVNDSYTEGYFGLSGSTSTLNKDTLSFLQRFAIQSDEHWSKYVTSIAPIDSFFGIKYIIEGNNSDDNIDSLVNGNYILVYNDENASTYQNPFAFPLGFSVDSYMIEKIDIKNSLSTFKTVNSIYSAILGYDCEVVKRLDNNLILSYEFENCQRANKMSFLFTADEGKTGKFTLIIKLDNTKDIYLYFPEYNNLIDAKYQINGIDMGHFASTERENKILYLSGYSNDEVRIIFEFEDEFGIGWDSPVIAYVDYDVLKLASEKANKNGLNIINFSQNYISATINSNEDTTILTTIPYDKGWQITVDGEKAETKESLDALLAFNITKGEHVIEFSYIPKEYIYSYILFSVGVVIFILIIIIENRNKNKIQLKNIEEN